MAAAGQGRPPSPPSSSVPSGQPEEGSSSGGDAPTDVSGPSQTALLGGEGSAALEEGQAYSMEAEASGPIHLEYVPPACCGSASPCMPSCSNLLTAGVVAPSPVQQGNARELAGRPGTSPAV